MKIGSKYLRKIISLISNNNQNELEDNYLDYITCLAGEGEELDKNQLLPQNNNELKQGVLLLKPKFCSLLGFNKLLKSLLF